MSSRAEILALVDKNQPSHVDAPIIDMLATVNQSPEIILNTFCTSATNIGSQIIFIDSLDDIEGHVQQRIISPLRVVSPIPELKTFAEDSSVLNEANPHSLENVELAILKAEFGVAENGALWLTEQQMGNRVLPFITQHLALIVDATAIVADMHAAYKRTENADYGFATFISGPSKTADIEQSLVLGAHGSRSLIIFILKQV
ncbi:LutC/YkgG family protein [Mucilaginibacter polytrichastri]|uniref:LUD domain-containing protein n=1 Tax=Mucilaginibacter polytrichastri TaxID=1302689 RepID=A0A1Q5ZX24_9SPHI|nr:LUD domain-containing protein [Mucilaginibacter polytrichastri]OKS86301.1 hypothetical protein RG47T_1753 [Mucilaginibacter polytrichastri]SFT16749.1 L-lactate dehydrogenase complex protein LldG [Mucilaginibacter polytrichastri]